MWSKLSIKLQLILFMTFVVSLVEISTLIVMHKIQKDESMQSTIIDVDTLTKSLNNDFLRAILNPSTDVLSDITYRLSAFKNINSVILFNQKSEPIFQYGKPKQILAHKNTIIHNGHLFESDNLFVKKSLSADNYEFGFILIDTNLSKYKRKQNVIMWTLLSIFPFALLLGFFISLYLSKSYTKPFTELLDAMKKSDPTNGTITLVQTSAQNEIKELFFGFNTLMQQVKNAASKLHYQAEHDQLTGMKNRFFMEEKLQEALKDEEQNHYNLLYLNLDQFKLVNDAAGHQTGDKLLQMVACEYNTILPNNAIFARVDGDGFMILLEDSNQTDGVKFLEKSIEKFHDFRFTSNGESYSISASIGMVYFKPFEYTLNELIKNINSALYSAKATGRNKAYIFNPDDDISQRLNMEVETASFIKEALSNGPSKFELFAQAIVPLQYETDNYSYEILIRMWDKENNFIAPDNFLPTAGRYQLMVEIDIWVLWTYLQTVTQNPDHLKNLHSAHINLAGASLTNPDFQAKVKEAVIHFNFPWNKLELEVTETSAVGDFNKANEFIVWLKNIGIGLALDDFGTGMASFEYLKSLPFDVVKIDGSFVKDMHTDPIDKAVIKYIHEISELKGQETVAEYVETQEDVDELTKIGINYGQGYFLGKPKPLKEWL